jgi:hypothetical protein
MAHGLIERGLRNTHRARGGLDAGTFESLHDLPEAKTLDASEQPGNRNLEAVEGEFVFLHPAIADHRDLASRQAGSGERLVIRPARLLG